MLDTWQPSSQPPHTTHFVSRHWCGRYTLLGKFRWELSSPVGQEGSEPSGKS